MMYKQDIENAKAQKKSNKKLMQRLKRLPEKEADRLFHEAHDETFEEIDCLKCANCCKTTSPIFRDVDIERLAKRLRLPAVQFITQFLRMDEDGDYVLQSSPCVFLEEDHTCRVYEDRPLACREYPHTNRKKMQQILNLTLKNAEICPAVSRILEGFKKAQI
jgi:Fe-S-cluster containining protein